MSETQQQPVTQAALPEKKYRGGVLIIGSLYWDPKRADWRNAYLTNEKKDERLVRAPIRYGRISGSRNHIYTMVFSKDCDNLQLNGNGRFVPFRSELSLSDLHSQAIALIKAEQDKSALKDENYYWSWGSLCIRINPHIDVADQAAITDAWKAKFGGKDKNMNKYHHRKEKNLLLSDGFLDIDWPPELHGVDFFLATAIQPNVPAYPKPGDLAALMKVPEQKEYFDNNVLHGIRTFQDPIVEAYVKNKGIQRENLYLLIYSLVVGSVLGTFIFDFFDVMLLGIQTPGWDYFNEHGDLLICKGLMFLGCLVFYISDYLNTTFVMGRRKTRLWVDITLLLVIAGFTLKSILLKSPDEPAITLIIIGYLVFFVYYIIFFLIDKKLRHKFYRDMFAGLIAFAVLFGVILFRKRLRISLFEDWYGELQGWVCATAILMIISAIVYAVFVWRRWDEDFGG